MHLEVDNFAHNKMLTYLPTGCVFSWRVCNVYIVIDRQVGSVTFCNSCFARVPIISHQSFVNSSLDSAVVIIVVCRCRVFKKVNCFINYNFMLFRLQVLVSDSQC